MADEHRDDPLRDYQPQDQIERDKRVFGAARRRAGIIVIPGEPKAREGDTAARRLIVDPLPLRGSAAPAGDDSEQ
jgi:hypothetical protein